MNFKLVAKMVIGRIIIGVIPIFTNQKIIFFKILDIFFLNLIFSFGNNNSNKRKKIIPIDTIRLFKTIKNYTKLNAY
jgi:hypothetical protein